MPLPRWCRLRVPIVALGVVAVGAAPVPPSDWDLWSAEDKRTWFRQNLDIGRGGSEPVDWAEGPEYPNMCVNAEFLRPGGFKTRSDVVKPYEFRVFNLHGTGIVAEVKAVWDSNRYTGMFQNAELGFARWGFQTTTFEMAAKMAAVKAYNAGIYRPEPMPNPPPPDPDCTIFDCFNVRQAPIFNEADLEDSDRPGPETFMAVKFFRDGVPSASLHLGGIGTHWDHIATQYSNLLQKTQGDAPNSTRYGMNGHSEMGAQRGTRWPGFTGLHDMAMYTQDGSLEHDINFPMQLLLQPTPQARKIIPMTCHGSYEDTLRIAKEGRLGPGTPIYKIYAKHSMEDPIVPIGTLQLASELMISADTDKQVFFYHARYERDLAIRPDLLQGYGCTDFWKCLVCPSVPELCHPNEETLKALDLFREGKVTLREAFPKARRPSTTQMPCKRELTLEQIEHEKRELPRAWAWVERAKRRKERGNSSAEAEEDSWPPWKEHERPAAGASAPAASPEAGAASLRGVASLRQVGSHRQLRRSPLAREAEVGMREDDAQLPVDPISNFQHTDNWICQNRPDEWPTAPRPYPWTPNCERSLNPSRLPSEPEYSVDDATCAELPPCSKHDGTWYSHVYPCTCGESTCNTGQLCTKVNSKCTTWGPYSKS